MPTLLNCDVLVIVQAHSELFGA